MAGNLLMTNPAYLDPLISRPIGWLMLGMMAVLMVVGVFWMSRVVKVEV
jgi:tight adherence protein B